MKKNYLFLGLLLISSFSTLGQMAQIDYGSDPSPQPLPSGCVEVKENNVSYYVPSYVPTISTPECVTFNGQSQAGITIETTPQTFEVEAGNYIHLQENTHIKTKAHLKIDYTPDFELVWYTPSQAGVASRYEKMEIGLKPSQEILDRIDFFFQNGGASPTALNPFNRHDIDFQMTFFHNGQPIDRVDAFYYTPQKIVANEMIDDTTSYPFRFRHSPREAGNYTAQVDLFVSEYLWKRIYFDFTVVESNNPGNLEQGVNHHHLRYAKTKESFFGVGQCIPWTEVESLSDWNESASFQRLKDEMGIPFEKLNDAEGNFPRIVAAPWSMQFETEVLGNYHPKRDQAWYLDRLSDFCVQEEVYFLYCMKLHSDFESGKWYPSVNSGWEENAYNMNRTISYPYASEPVPPVSTVQEFFTNQQAKDYYKNFMRYIVSRWGYSTSIAGWQIMSEINVTDGYFSDESGTGHRVVVHDWIDEMAAFMDTIQFDRHLRSIAIVGDTTRGALNVAHTMEIFKSKYIHFTGIHTYSNQNINLYASHEGQEGGLFRNRNLLATYEAVRNISTGSNGYVYPLPITDYQDKPFIFDEYGLSIGSVTAGPDSALNTVIGLNKCSGHAFHNDLWSSVCSGSATTGLDWWVSSYPERHQMWYEEFHGIKEFFKDIDFESVDYSERHFDNDVGLYAAQRWPWKEETITETNHNKLTLKGYEKNTALEGYAMVSKDKNQGFGWLHNRSHYWYNLPEFDPCLEILIKGLSPWSVPAVMRPRDDDTLTVGYRAVNLNNDYIKVRHLKKSKRYIIRYYHPQTNAFLDEQVRWSSPLGKIKIKPSVLSTVHEDVAFKLIQFNEDWKSLNDTTMFEDMDEETLIEIERNKDIVIIYPNPSDGTFSIDAQGVKITRISITDAQGAVLLKRNQVNATKETVSLTTESSIVFVTTELETGVLTTKKIVINP